MSGNCELDRIETTDGKLQTYGLTVNRHAPSASRRYLEASRTTLVPCHARSTPINVSLNMTV